MADSNYWLDKWQSNDILFHQSDVNGYLKDHFPQAKEGRVFVPLCGKSLDMIWLRDQGLDVVGCELSSIACESFFTENGLVFEREQIPNFVAYRGERVTLFCGNLFDLNNDTLGELNFVYDRACLIALNQSLRKKYRDHLIRLIGDQRVEMLLLLMEYPENEIDGPPFSVNKDEVEALFADKFKIEQCVLEANMKLSTHHPKFLGVHNIKDSVYILKS